jgi:hypothetical protein
MNYPVYAYELDCENEIRLRRYWWKGEGERWVIATSGSHFLSKDGKWEYDPDRGTPFYAAFAWNSCEEAAAFWETNKESALRQLGGEI